MLLLSFVVKVSMTMSLATVVTVTEAGGLLFPVLETKVPRVSLRSTPARDTAPKTIEAALRTLTVMTALPLAGESRYHISVR